MRTLTQRNENKQQNKFETVAGTGAVINDSLETEPTLFELYGKSASATGTAYCSPQSYRQMKIFTLIDWFINQTANIIFYGESLEPACIG